MLVCPQPVRIGYPVEVMLTFVLVLIRHHNLVLQVPKAPFAVSSSVESLITRWMRLWTSCVLNRVRHFHSVRGQVYSSILTQ